jgi:hypothetical protein
VQYTESIDLKMHRMHFKINGASLLQYHLSVCNFKKQQVHEISGFQASVTVQLRLLLFWEVAQIFRWLPLFRVKIGYIFKESKHLEDGTDRFSRNNGK